MSEHRVVCVAGGEQHVGRNMPEMHGLDLVQEVRRLDALKAIPILMITTMSAKEDIVVALKAGVNNYVVKPFDVPTLQAKIQQLVGSK
jgi:two-component system, chemotaxis family, chemotaxis protein CheY